MLSDPKDRALGIAIQTLREESGLPGEDLASRAEVSDSRLEQIEAGREDPDWATVRRIARGLGVDLSHLAEVAERFEKAL